MNNPIPEIIYHNYPASPVAEKVRVVFGLKNLSWNNVEIPRLPPKPMLTLLTGGYRRTPVMQIGADIYCDSQCIIRELDRRYPTPSAMPGSNTGLLWNLSRWTDGGLFDLSVKIVLGSAGSKLPSDFAEDRGRLYLGKDWAEGLKKANAQLPHLVAQMRAPLSWLDSQLADGRNFLTGPKPAAIDAQIYHVVWFVRGRWEGGPEFLKEFAHLCQWEESVAKLGHGEQTDMSPEQAIEIAKSVTPIDRSGIADNEPQGLKVGDSVTVGPDVDGGEQAVAGRVYFADASTISIERDEPEIGRVCVHFPRAGYRVDMV